MDIKIEQSWKSKLEQEFNKPYFEKLRDFVRNEYLKKLVYPEAKNIFKAFELTPFENVKVVILGQDPYHGEGQANGLCFSVNKGVAIPPSLRNIYTEIEKDLGATTDDTLANNGIGNLEGWAKQGVLLLNATLTVLANRAGSHQGKGWEEFTDAVICKLSDEREGLVFILWGKYAQEKGKVIDEKKHLVLKAAHPSPLSAHSGFFGCKHFSKANEYLIKNGLGPIDWLNLR